MILFLSGILITVANNQCLGIGLKQKNNMRHEKKITKTGTLFLRKEILFFSY